MSEEPGGVLGGFSASCKEFGEVEGCFCTHHKQLSQTGTVVQMATWNAKVAFFFFSFNPDVARVGGNADAE